MLDLARGKMLIADQSVTLVAKSCDSDTQCSCVIVLEKCFIPPYSEMEIVAHIVAKEIWIVNTDVSLCKHSKIAKTKMIDNLEICSTCKQAETASKLDPSMKDIPLLLPDDIISAQKDHKGLAPRNTNTWL